MSLTPRGSLVLQRVKLGDVLEICDGIIFEFYPGLPHILARANHKITKNWTFYQFSLYHHIIAVLYENNSPALIFSSWAIQEPHVKYVCIICLEKTPMCWKMCRSLLSTLGVPVTLLATLTLHVWVYCCPSVGFPPSVMDTSTVCKSSGTHHSYLVQLELGNGRICIWCTKICCLNFADHKMQK